MAIEKYIIDKSDLTALLRGECLAIQPKGQIKGFCIEIAGDLTNGDVIKAVFPEISRTLLFHIENHMGQDWWNAPYKGGKE